MYRSHDTYTGKTGTSHMTLVIHQQHVTEHAFFLTNSVFFKIIRIHSHLSCKTLTLICISSFIPLYVPSSDDAFHTYHFIVMLNFLVCKGLLLVV